jgi:hypothetical protein
MYFFCPPWGREKKEKIGGYMALVTRASTVSMDAGIGMYLPQITGLVAGEDLLAGAPCYIKAADGKIYMSNGTAATEPAKCDGFTPVARLNGQPVTLYGRGARFNYGTGLTIGAATTGDAVGVARVINATDIRVIRDT